MEPLRLFCFADSPVGRLRLAQQGGALCALAPASAPLPAPWRQGDSPLLALARRELEAYFAGRLRRFSVPLAPAGTAFQRSCWAALCRIPYGETRTYGQQAAALGRPRAARAVGSANRANPIMILIPCHRVIGANGALTGYAGGLAMKQFLLGLERANR